MAEPMAPLAIAGVACTITAAVVKGGIVTVEIGASGITYLQDSTQNANKCHGIESSVETLYRDLESIPDHLEVYTDAHGAVKNRFMTDPEKRIHCKLLEDAKSQQEEVPRYMDGFLRRTKHSLGRFVLYFDSSQVTSVEAEIFKFTARTKDLLGRLRDGANNWKAADNAISSDQAAISNDERKRANHLKRLEREDQLRRDRAAQKEREPDPIARRNARRVEAFPDEPESDSSESEAGSEPDGELESGGQLEPKTKKKRTVKQRVAESLQSLKESLVSLAHPRRMKGMQAGGTMEPKAPARPKDPRARAIQDAGAKMRDPYRNNEALRPATQTRHPAKDKKGKKAMNVDVAPESTIGLHALQTLLPSTTRQQTELPPTPREGTHSNLLDDPDIQAAIRLSLADPSVESLHRGSRTPRAGPSTARPPRVEEPRFVVRESEG